MATAVATQVLRQVIRGGTLATGLMEFVVEGVNAQQTPARTFDFTLERSSAVRCPGSSPCSLGSTHIVVSIRRLCSRQSDVATGPSAEEVYVDYARVRTYCTSPCLGQQRPGTREAFWGRRPAQA